MFESGKRVECFPNDAQISREKVEKRNLNYLVRKIDKTGSADRASDTVTVALHVLRERMKTFRSLRNSFAAKKANRFGLKEDTLNIIWTKTLFFHLRQTLLQAVVIYARHTLRCVRTVSVIILQYITLKIF